MENGLKNAVLIFQKVSPGRFCTLVSLLSGVPPRKWPFLGTLRIKIWQFLAKLPKIDLFSKNVPNHPDFAPGKFGWPKPSKKGSFGPITLKNLYTAPLLTKHWSADISWSRPKLPKIDLFSKNVPNHPDFAPGNFGGPKPSKRGHLRPSPSKIYT